MIEDVTVLSTSWIRQTACDDRPARTLIVGAAVLTCRQRFGGVAFNLQTHATTVTDNPAETIAWLGDVLQNNVKRLLLWRAENNVLPALISAAETARDTVAAVRMLRSLQLACAGELLDVANGYGGSAVTSFDAVAHAAGVAFVPMSRFDLAEAHRTGNQWLIRHHLAARAKATWCLWLAGSGDTGPLVAATNDWLATPAAQVRA